MIAKEAGERECLIDRALGARTLAEITEAERQLRAYMTAHPEDRNIVAVGEPLALRRMGLEEDTVQDAQAA